MKKDKPEKPEIKLTKDELQGIVNLLFSGKFGFSAREGQQVVTPLINKLSQMLDALTK